MLNDQANINVVNCKPSGAYVNLIEDSDLEGEVLQLLEFFGLTNVDVAVSSLLVLKAIYSNEAQRNSAKQTLSDLPIIDNVSLYKWKLNLEYKNDLKTRLFNANSTSLSLMFNMGGSTSTNQPNVEHWTTVLRDVQLSKQSRDLLHFSASRLFRFHKTKRQTKVFRIWIFKERIKPAIMP